MSNENSLNLDDDTFCDKEVIHTPGTIQPHGCLIVFTEGDLIIRQISANANIFFKSPLEKILNNSLKAFLTSHQIKSLNKYLKRENVNQAPQWVFNFILPQDNKNHKYNALVHRHQGLCYLELEPHTLFNSSHHKNYFYKIQYQLFLKFAETRTLTELLDLTVKSIQDITDFNRVMVYKFDENGHGQVIAEVVSSMDSLLNLHFPATDIPKPARNLMLKRKIGMIPNTNYEPIAIIPDYNPLTNLPLDMSFVTLRHVSPRCTQFLRNMNVSASLVITLHKNNELWGMISAHHDAPKYLPFENRTLCEFIGEYTSFNIPSKIDNDFREDRLKLKSLQTDLMESFARFDDFEQFKELDPQKIINYMNAQGAALILEGKYYLFGNTPSRDQLEELLNWLDDNLEEQEKYFTFDSLPGIYPPAMDFKDIASGLLGIVISKELSHYVLWFRKEIIQSITWGGNPKDFIKPAHILPTPRHSFERWKEIIKNKSYPWLQVEIESVLQFRDYLIGVILKNLQKGARLSISLSKSNEDLRSFAYAASHDLREPLRSIHNYSSMILSLYGSDLNEDITRKLQRITQLADQMGNQTSSLLCYAKAGQDDIYREVVDLNLILRDVLERINLIIKEQDVTVRIPSPLPSLKCNPIHIDQIFLNLITNAIKYNTKKEKWVEIGFFTKMQPNQPRRKELILYVKDNGIGIAPHHLQIIFQIFKRLHTSNEFGGGTGVGLALVKKLIDCHNGRIWVESTENEGSTFYFTINEEYSIHEP